MSKNTNNFLASREKERKLSMNKQFEVNFSLTEESKGCRFEDLAKKHEAYILELGKDGLPVEITYPISEKTHCIEYDDKDKYSETACAWLMLHLLDKGYRVFSYKNHFFVNTALSKNELRAVIDELMPKLIDSDEFWDMLKCYEDYQTSLRQ